MHAFRFRKGYILELQQSNLRHLHSQTRKHSTRMHTAHLLTRGRCSDVTSCYGQHHPILDSTTPSQYHSPFHGTPFTATPSQHPFTATPFTAPLHSNPFTASPFHSTPLQHPIYSIRMHSTTTTPCTAPPRRHTDRYNTLPCPKHRLWAEK